MEMFNLVEYTALHQTTTAMLLSQNMTIPDMTKLRLLVFDMKDE
jgi:hypothetical protein